MVLKSRRRTPAAETDWDELRHRLVCRSGGTCECCGTPLGIRPWQAHHRQPRGMGGTRNPDVNALSRLVALHERCHLWVESYRDVARARGLLVPQGQDCRTAVFVTSGGQRVLLDDSGLYVPAPGPAWELHVDLPSIADLTGH